MVTTTESSSNHHSPTSAPSSAAALSADSSSSSPKFPRKNLPSPWAQVVRGGGEPESTAGTRHSPPPSSSSSSSSLSASAASVPDQPPQSADSSPSPKAAVPASPPVDNWSIVTAPLDSSDGGDGNAGRSKKPAWNKPSNGVVSEAVMGDSWPALSASTKAVTGKLAAESNSKTAVDGSLSTSQVRFQ